MSIKHAILGFLSWKPLTGYDLKKLFAESETFHWSGNSNQIYTTLIDLHKENLVTQEIQHQDDRPSRKVYHITEAGRAELRRWVLSAPELPQTRSAFLIQLAWADQLDAGELDDLLNRYEDEVRVHLMMLREHRQRGTVSPDRTPRETLLWEAVMENRMAGYENELTWVRWLREELRAGKAQE